MATARGLAIRPRCWGEPIRRQEIRVATAHTRLTPMLNAATRPESHFKSYLHLSLGENRYPTPLRFTIHRPDCLSTGDNR